MGIDDYNIKERFSFIDFEFHAEIDLKGAVHRDCGLFYKRKTFFKNATDNFNQSLEYNPEGYQSLLERSKCTLEIGNVFDQWRGVSETLSQQYPRQ